MTTKQRQLNHAQTFLTTITTPGAIIEIRALNDGGSASFLFTDMRMAARVALKLNSEHAANVYYTVNPISPDSRTARSHHPLNVPRLRGTRSASDDEIQRVVWYPIDIDPVRPSGTASTDAQLAEAHATMERLRTDRVNAGWPEPIIICSGNGYHLLYRADGTTENSIDWRGALRALAARFDTETAKIDTTVGNPSRILRLPGFFNRKGVATEQRPHRLARAVSYPEVISVLDIGKVRELAWSNSPRPTAHSDRKLAIDEGGVLAFIAEFPEQLKLSKVTHVDGEVWFALAECPFVGREHEGMHVGKGKTAIRLNELEGKLGFSCFAGPCSGHTISQLRELLNEKTGRWPSMPFWKDNFAYEVAEAKFGGVENYSMVNSPWLTVDEVMQGYSALTDRDPAWEVPTRESVAREHAALMAAYSPEALRREYLEHREHREPKELPLTMEQLKAFIAEEGA